MKIQYNFFKYIFSIGAIFIVCIPQITQSQPIQKINISYLDAVRNNDLDSTLYWLERGAEVNYTDSANNSALHIHILNNNNYNTEILNLLIEHEINTNLKNSGGQTPLMLTAYNGFLKWCDILLQNGALLQLKDNYGNDALSYAYQNCNYKVIDYFTNPKSYLLHDDYQDYYFMATRYLKENDLINGIKYLELSKILTETEICKENIDYGIIRNELAEAYLHNGEVQKSLPLLKEAYDIFITRFKSQNDIISFSAYTSIYPVLAETYIALGNFYLAEKIYEEALLQIENAVGNNNPYYYEIISHIARLYAVAEDYTNAEYMYKFILSNTANTFGENHPNYLENLINLGIIYEKTGDNTKAVDICSKFTNIFDKIRNCQTELSSENLNDILFKFGYLNLLLKNYDEAKAILEYVYENETEDISKSLILDKLGYIYWDLGDLNLAKSIFETSLEYEKKNLFNKYNSNYDTYLFLGTICEENGDTLNAQYYYTQIFNKLEQSILRKFYFISEEERILLWNKNRIYSEHLIPSFAFSYLQVPESRSLAYNNILFNKSILRNTSLDMYNIVSNSNNQILLGKYNAIKRVRQEIFMKNFINNYENSDNLKKLEYLADSLENDLIVNFGIIRELISDNIIRHVDIRERLKDNEVAVEFAQFPIFNKQWSDSIMNCALIVKKDLDHPLMIPLFEQKQLDSILAKGNINVDNLYASRGVVLINNAQTQGNGNILYDLIWKPLEKELKDIKTVYYSPAGTLHQIAFAALPADSALLLCEKFNLVQLSSTRQLATEAWHSSPAAITGAALFGGIKYDLEERDFLEIQKAQTPNELTVSRNFISDSTFRSQSFSFLHGSLTETVGITKTFANAGINAIAYTGIYATEESFKSLSNENINLLHIATHGYFYPNPEVKLESRKRLMLMGENRFQQAQNPLLRSGLIMAGGNHAWKGNEPIPGLEDGILTAAEIADMNLTDVDLVVLSACETGLGDINGSEGVFGLQRAFKLAGVKTIIMSLWKVPDIETSEMMQSFYRKWLGGMDKHEAFRLTQREMHLKYPDQPHKWAGFVMVD